MQRQQEESARQLHEELLKQQEENRLYNGRISSSGIPIRFIGGTLDNYDPSSNDKALKVATEYVKDFAGRIKTGRGLMMIGEVGRGKTRLATTIAIEAMRQRYTARYVTTVSLLDRIKETFAQGSRESEEDVINGFTQCNFLVLDDFGKENPTQWSEERIFRIIDERYAKCRPIIITTNIGIDDIKTRYPWSGEAIVSRLYETCTGIMLTGPDKRRKQTP